MFLIENFLKERKRKIAKWESDCQKWVDEGEHRSASNYKYWHPYPVKTYENWWENIGYSFLVGVVVFMIYGLVQSGIAEADHIANATEKGKNCRMFNREDTIRIATGEYKDTQGKIVGGCNKGDDYQIKLADGSFADLNGDTEGRVAVGTRVVAVGSYKDLVVIEEPKDAKPESK